MIKRVILSLIILITILGAGFILAQNPPEKTSDIESYIIVIGNDAEPLDSTTANSIGFSLRKLNYKVNVVKDLYFQDDNISNIIIVGGSCVNSLSAEILDLDYPTCNIDFKYATNTNTGQYFIKTWRISDNRIKILIAGYNKLDTVEGAKYFLNFTLNNLYPDTEFIGTSKKY